MRIQARPPPQPPSSHRSAWSPRRRTEGHRRGPTPRSRRAAPTPVQVRGGKTTFRPPHQAGRRSLPNKGWGWRGSFEGPDGQARQNAERSRGGARWRRKSSVGLMLEPKRWSSRLDRVARKLDHPGERLGEVRAAPISEGGLEPGGVSRSACEVLKTFAINLLVGHINEGRFGVGHFDDQLRKVRDRNLRPPSNIESPALGLWLSHQANARVDYVRHISKGPRLGPVSVDGERFTAQSLIDETRGNHAVMPRLPRPDRVEQSGDDSGQSPVLEVDIREDFIDRL